MTLADLRRDYHLAGLRRKDLVPDPIQQFQNWLDQAVKANVLEPNAVTLATVDPQGRPTARTMLLKGIDARGFVFFTNYNSRKARDLDRNPRVSLLVFWRELERQACVCGAVSKVSREESEHYFSSRPAGSRLAAWASAQSEIIPNREFLEKKLSDATARYGQENIPCPPHWGGYILAPETVEFWQGGPSRLHDRFLYTRQGAGWRIDRLSP